MNSMNFALKCGRVLCHESPLLAHSRLISDLVDLTHPSEHVPLDVSLEELERLHTLLDSTGWGVPPEKLVQLAIPTADYLLVPRALIDRVTMGQHRDEIIRAMAGHWSLHITYLTKEELAAPIPTHHGVVQTLLTLVDPAPHWKLLGLAVCRVSDAQDVHWQLYFKVGSFYRMFTCSLFPEHLVRQELRTCDPCGQNAYVGFYPNQWITRHQWLYRGVGHGLPATT